MSQLDAWRPSASFEALRLRASVNRCLRTFFAERDVLEIETPVLSGAGNTDPNIASFHVDSSGRGEVAMRKRWLRTSPEFALKRLIAAGIGDCYELGRVFRDGEAGGRHNPEFTMLEWYRMGFDHIAMAREVVDVVERCLQLVGRTANVVVSTYAALFRSHTGLDPHVADIPDLRRVLGDVLIDPHGLERDDWLDLIMSHRIQPSFPAGVVTVVHDYPASQCALARVRDGAPAVAERFEVFLGPLELANGYHELTDAAEQRRRFEADAARRRDRGDRPIPHDHHMLDALAHGLPDCAGVALGVDRLLMAMLETPRIADVIAFGFDRA